MRLNVLRRCISTIVFVVTIAFSPAGGAKEADYPAVLTWDELAAHAGLVGVKAKTAAQFRVDVDFLLAKKISALKAATHLTGEEWAYISSNNPNHLLHPWFTNRMDVDTWKSTVDLILANKQITVNRDRLNYTDPAVTIRRPDMRDVRVYLLSPIPTGRAACSFTFPSLRLVPCRPSTSRMLSGWRAWHLAEQ